MNFRPDINGLRAIAVIAVVLFHFNPTWIPGGFAGVDVFFVISGFLMTRIILDGLESKNFRLFKFYSDRANRIIPALTALCLVLLAFGWFYLTPLGYKALSKHVLGSMGFFSNLIYWTESGYFDVASHEKWLLHTWSLSIEWQFYVIYPLVLLVSNRFMSIMNIKRLITFGTALSLLFCIYATLKWPTASYYILSVRAWEMMLGGLAYIYPWKVSSQKKKHLEHLGLSLIIISYVFVSSATPWPGHFALIPVLGTYFVIIANRKSSIITSNSILQHLGKWSYSIYLWHWPIAVYINYYDLNKWILVGIFLSLAVGFLSYTFIEKLKFKHIFLLAIINIGFSIEVYSKNGFVNQMPIHVFDLLDINVNGDEYGKYTWRHHRSLQENTLSDVQSNMLIIGDSQAGDFINMLFELEVDERFNLTSLQVPAKCSAPYLVGDDIKAWEKISPELKSGKLKKEHCTQAWSSVHNNEKVINSDIIILSMNWRVYSDKLIKASIRNLRQLNDNARIIIISSKGLGVDIPKFIYDTHRTNSLTNEKNLYITATSRLDEMDKLEQYLIGIDDNYQYINFRNIICSDIEKTCSYLSNGKPIFYDKVHSTKVGNIFLAERLTTYFRLHEL
ncbi:acyltransferase [Vibrio lamellibrachiae]|uniref:acyltransferase family protein n=1 Tax=Vibrio lamellibrachiae TaxID=2910253 RepID=UPI003D1522F8